MQIKELAKKLESGKIMFFIAFRSECWPSKERLDDNLVTVYEDHYVSHAKTH